MILQVSSIYQLMLRNSKKTMLSTQKKKHSSSGTLKKWLASGLISHNAKQLLSLAFLSYTGLANTSRERREMDSI